jgi:Histidine kinase-, DNA gyrase B-, and HSP90-like ATPase
MKRTSALQMCYPRLLAADLRVPPGPASGRKQQAAAVLLPFYDFSPLVESRLGNALLSDSIAQDRYEHPSQQAAGGAVAETQNPNGGASNATIQVNPGRILRAIARIGYTPESAICDIVDNSVSAEARNVSIEIEQEPGMAENRRNNAARYIIADDGKGMDESQLPAALSLGAVSESHAGKLGKYGLGLKSAALSQGDRIEIVSTTAVGHWHKVALDLPHIEASGRLECQIMPPSDDDMSRWQRLLPDAIHGTIVTIEKIHKKNHPSVRKTRNALERTLGVTYLYFLQDRGMPLSLFLDGESVGPFDPLFVTEAERNGGLDERTWDGRDVRWLETPKRVVLDPESNITATIEATQLVHPPAFDNPAEIRKQYMIGAYNYGFYIYRNKRLIRWAERFDGMIPTDQGYFAFRGRLLIDDTSDDVLNIDVKKSEILLSEEAEASLSEAVYEARRKSRKAWDNAAALLRKQANEDPDSRADEALIDVHFPDTLPTDPDDERTETVRKERERKEEQLRPLNPREREQARKEGSKVMLVDQLDDNALWERAYDASLGTIVRLNRSHRFTRLFYDRFGADADVVLLVKALFLSLAVAESRSIRNLQSLSDEELEQVFQRYRDQASAAVYHVTADALEQRFA